MHKFFIVGTSSFRNSNKLKQYCLLIKIIVIIIIIIV